MAEQNCKENQMKNEEWICEKRDLAMENEEMKQKMSNLDKEMFLILSQKQEEKERAANQIAKLNEVVEQLQNELNQMQEHLADNEEYTTKLEEKIKR